MDWNWKLEICFVYFVFHSCIITIIIIICYLLFEIRKQQEVQRENWLFFSVFPSKFIYDYVNKEVSDERFFFFWDFFGGVL